MASLLAQGGPYASVLATGLLVNLRLLLMSAALASRVDGAQGALRPLLARALTDKSFAITIAEWDRAHQLDLLYSIGSGAAVFSAWQVSTWAGYRLANTIPAGFGLEFALPASLICLLFLIVCGTRAAVTAALAGVISLVLHALAPAWSVLAATMVAATAGLVLPWK